MKHITVTQAISTAVKIHDTGETWNSSIEKAFVIRRLINRAMDKGFTQEELLKLLFSGKSKDL